MMNQESILNILKSIKYPGYTRDIVSFGMIKNIEVESDIVNITLSISSNDKYIKNQLRKMIETEILKNTNFKNVGIFIIQPEIENNTSAPTEGKSQNISGIKKIIAIASGKGGVGKSTISVNLASKLSENYRVGILDLDIYGPSLPTLTGISESPRLTQEKKIIPIEKFGMKLMSFGFISGNNTPAIWRGPMVARMTQQFFDDVLWGDLDYLILDLPPGTGDIQLTLVQKIALTGAIIVTTPQQLALLDVQKGSDMFKKVNTPVLGIIENMTHFECPHCNEISEIFPGSSGDIESSRIDVPLLGRIPISSQLAISSDNGKPFVFENPDSTIAKEYTEISKKIVDLS